MKEFQSHVIRTCRLLYYTSSPAGTGCLDLIAGRASTCIAMPVFSPRALRNAVVLFVMSLILLTFYHFPSDPAKLSSVTPVYGNWTIEQIIHESKDSEIDWSRFAYTQYVTDTEYLCNSVMLFEALHRLGSKAERLMMYPENYSVADETSKESKLLRIARDKYGVKPKPIEVQSRLGGDSGF